MDIYHKNIDKKKINDSFMSRLCNSFSCNQHVEHRQPLDIIHCLLMGHHGEVIAIELQDLVMNSESTPAGGALLHHRRHIDPVVFVPLWTLPVVLVDVPH